jgi:hypothetical protein
MAQMWLWLAVGIAYVALAIVEWYFASHIETINLSQPLERYPVFTDSQEKIQKLRYDANQRLAEQQRRFAEGLINQSVLNAAHDYWQLTNIGLTDSAEKLNLNNAFTSIENVAQKFDKAAKANRLILRIAAVSFFVAAGISFAQGLSLI